ncbi:MAG: hypothetical protein ABI690_10515 [Chloroflexota bacterium]
MTFRFRNRLFQIGCVVGLIAIMIISQGQSAATGLASQTATYTATATQPTLRPTLTLTPSITFTPTPSRAWVVASRELPVRSGPGLQYGIVGTIEPDVAMPFYVMSDDGNWVLLSQAGEPGRWLGLSPFVRLDGEWSEIPIMGASPTPTPTVTPSGTATITPTPIPTVDVDGDCRDSRISGVSNLVRPGDRQSSVKIVWILQAVYNCTNFGNICPLAWCSSKR